MIQIGESDWAKQRILLSNPNATTARRFVFKDDEVTAPADHSLEEDINGRRSLMLLKDMIPQLLRHFTFTEVCRWLITLFRSDSIIFSPSTTFNWRVFSPRHLSSR